MLSQTDLTNCDKEQIHLVAAIQPHGFFFAFRLADKTIYHASANVPDLTSVSASDATGKSLSAVFGEATAKVLIKEAQAVTESEPRVLRLRDLCGKPGLYEVYLYELDGLIGVEIEGRQVTSEDDSPEFSLAHRRNRIFAEDLNANDSLENIAKVTCRTIRSMIGFDRVMMYRYLPSWDGEVIAEDKSAEAHSFLQHRFPATDIPLPARQLYLKNRSRLIADSSAAAIQIQPSSHYITRKTIDLSNSKLRAVSPIHLEYLKNMGVGGSFSVAVIVAGELWGLIACHSKEPMSIPLETRLACEAVAATFASLATIKEQVNQQTQTIQFEERLRTLFGEWIASPQLVSSLMKSHAAIESLFEASGVALITGEKIEIAGLTPPESMIKELGAYLKQRFTSERKSILAVDNLASLDPKFERLK
ncbi:MAG: GAF domain-containing protein, partial [Proteobacteria bacterium]